MDENNKKSLEAAAPTESHRDSDLKQLSPSLPLLSEGHVRKTKELFEQMTSDQDNLHYYDGNSIVEFDGYENQPAGAMRFNVEAVETSVPPTLPPKPRNLKTMAHNHHGDSSEHAFCLVDSSLKPKTSPMNCQGKKQTTATSMIKKIPKENDVLSSSSQPISKKEQKHLPLPHPQIVIIDNNGTGNARSIPDFADNGNNRIRNYNRTSTLESVTTELETKYTVVSPSQQNCSHHSPHNSCPEESGQENPAFVLGDRVSKSPSPEAGMLVFPATIESAEEANESMVLTDVDEGYYYRHNIYRKNRLVSSTDDDYSQCYNEGDDGCNSSSICSDGDDNVDYKAKVISGDNNTEKLWSNNEEWKEGEKSEATQAMPAPKQTSSITTFLSSTQQLHHSRCSSQQSLPSSSDLNQFNNPSNKGDTFHTQLLNEMREKFLIPSLCSSCYGYRNDGEGAGKRKSSIARFVSSVDTESESSNTAGDKREPSDSICSGFFKTFSQNNIRHEPKEQQFSNTFFEPNFSKSTSQLDCNNGLRNNHGVDDVKTSDCKVYDEDNPEEAHRLRELHSIAAEFLKVQKVYVDLLHNISENYIHYIEECGAKRGKQMLPDTPTGQPHVIRRICDKLKLILGVHRDFLADFQCRLTDWDSRNPNLAEVLKQKADFLKMCIPFLKEKRTLVSEFQQSLAESKELSLITKRFEDGILNTGIAAPSETNQPSPLSSSLSMAKTSLVDESNNAGNNGGNKRSSSFSLQSSSSLSTLSSTTAATNSVECGTTSTSSLSITAAAEPSSLIHHLLTVPTSTSCSPSVLVSTLPLSAGTVLVTPPRLSIAMQLDAVHQNVVRYKLLMERYRKHLVVLPSSRHQQRILHSESAQIRFNTDDSHGNLSTDSPSIIEARIADEALAKLAEVSATVNDCLLVSADDPHKKLLELHRKLDGVFDVFGPARKLVMDGELLRQTRKQLQPRRLILFSDILLICRYALGSEDRFDLNRLHKIPLEDIHIRTEDHEDHETEFVLKSPNKTSAFFASSKRERDEWVEQITLARSQLLDAALQRRNNYSKSQSTSASSHCRSDGSSSHSPQQQQPVFSENNSHKSKVLVPSPPSNSPTTPSGTANALHSSNITLLLKNTELQAAFLLHDSTAECTNISSGELPNHLKSDQIHSNVGNSISATTKTSTKTDDVGLANASFSVSTAHPSININSLIPGPKANSSPVAAPHNASIFSGSTTPKYEALWIHDSKATGCLMNGCDTRFTFVRRRHHCRNCGWLICGRCVGYAPVHIRGHFERTKVCPDCYRKLKHLFERGRLFPEGTVMRILPPSSSVCESVSTKQQHNDPIFPTPGQRLPTMPNNGQKLDSNKQVPFPCFGGVPVLPTSTTIKYQIYDPSLRIRLLTTTTNTVMDDTKISRNDGYRCEGDNGMMVTKSEENCVCENDSILCNPEDRTEGSTIGVGNRPSSHRLTKPIQYSLVEPRHFFTAPENKGLRKARTQLSQHNHQSLVASKVFLRTEHKKVVAGHGKKTVVRWARLDSEMRLQFFKAEYDNQPAEHHFLYGYSLDTEELTESFGTNAASIGGRIFRLTHQNQFLTDRKAERIEFHVAHSGLAEKWLAALQKGLGPDNLEDDGGKK